MKKLISLIILFSIMLSLTSTFPAEGIEVSNDKISDEEYKVYSEAIPQLLELSTPATRLVIYDYTSIDNSGSFDKQAASYLKREMEMQQYGGYKLDEDMIKSFQDRNKVCCKIEDKFDNNLNVVLVTEEEIDSIFADFGGWDEFYKRYPDSCGTIAISRVGFSNAGNRALFYIGNQRHWLVGTGYYVVLAKIKDKWMVVGKVLAWIS